MLFITYECFYSHLISAFWSIRTHVINASFHSSYGGAGRKRSFAEKRVSFHPLYGGTERKRSSADRRTSRGKSFQEFSSQKNISNQSLSDECQGGGGFGEKFIDGISVNIKYNKIVLVVSQ